MYNRIYKLHFWIYARGGRGESSLLRQRLQIVGLYLLFRAGCQKQSPSAHGEKGDVENGETRNSDAAVCKGGWERIISLMLKTSTPIVSFFCDHSLNIFNLQSWHSIASCTKDEQYRARTVARLPGHYPICFALTNIICTWSLWIKNDFTKPTADKVFVH